VTTTTLRIEESLRERIARLASALNQTPHSFMVEALAQKADEAEWRLGVQREAQQRDTALQAGEPGVEWHEMKTYLRQRVAAAGKKTPRPAARKTQST
jgi:predicted transcriptional regulator